MGATGNWAYFDSRGPRPPLHPVAGGHDEITHHCRSRWRTAGTLAVEHQATSRLGLDDDGVERTIDRCQWVLQGNQCGVDTRRDTLLPFVVGDSLTRSPIA